MKKTVLIVVGILIALLLVLSVSKDLIVKASVEKGVQIVTGLKLSIQSLGVGIFRSAVSIRELKLFNRRGFKDRIMLHMPEIYVNYDLPAIMKGDIHLREVRIDLKEFVVVKNELGELNLDSLKVVKAEKAGKKPGTGEATPPPKIRIDELQLKIGKAIYKDYTAGPTPSVREFNINVNEKYSNITDPYALVSLIVVKALSNTAIASLANFDIGSLKGTISYTLGSATKALETATKSTQQTQEAVKSAQETIKKTTEALGSIFK